MLQTEIQRKPAVIKERIVALLIDESGSTAVEYGLLVSLVGVTVVTAMTEFGEVLRDMFEDIADKIDDAMR
jgi:Flp pilus assembly pilin Flp